jgi:hypothetical protein
MLHGREKSRLTSFRVPPSTPVGRRKRLSPSAVGRSENFMHASKAAMPRSPASCSGLGWKTSRRCTPTCCFMTWQRATASNKRWRSPTKFAPPRCGECVSAGRCCTTAVRRHERKPCYTTATGPAVLWRIPCSSALTTKRRCRPSSIPCEESLAPSLGCWRNVARSGILMYTPTESVPEPRGLRRVYPGSICGNPPHRDGFD